MDQTEIPSSSTLNLDFFHRSTTDLRKYLTQNHHVTSHNLKSSSLPKIFQNQLIKPLPITINL